MKWGCSNFTGLINTSLSRFLKFYCNSQANYYFRRRNNDTEFNFPVISLSETRLLAFTVQIILNNRIAGFVCDRVSMFVLKVSGS